MKGIKNITNGITRTKDSASKAIAYSHPSKVISSLLDGPRTEGKLVMAVGNQNRRQPMFVKKKKTPKTQKGEPIVYKIRRKKKIENS